jgi:hypothetical protein
MRQQHLHHGALHARSSSVTTSIHVALQSKLTTDSVFTYLCVAACYRSAHPFGNGAVHNDCMAKLEKRRVNDGGQLRGSVEQAQVQLDMVILSYHLQQLRVHSHGTYSSRKCCHAAYSQQWSLACLSLLTRLASAQQYEKAFV